MKEVHNLATEKAALQASLSAEQRYQHPYRCRAKMSHIRQSRPDSGLGFQVKFLTTEKAALQQSLSAAQRYISTRWSGVRI